MAGGNSGGDEKPGSVLILFVYRSFFLFFSRTSPPDYKEGALSVFAHLEWWPQ